MSKPYAHGDVCWHEHVSRDVEAAKTFYAAVAGWEFKDHEMPDGNIYVMGQLGGKDVAGLWAATAPEMADVPAHWLTYVWADDVDATAAKAAELGGTIVREPMDVMAEGRMAVLQDPAGVVFAIWHSSDDSEAPDFGAAPGAFSWFEVTTRDPETSRDFFTALFGWDTTVNDMAGFDYTMFTRGEAGLGGVMPMAGPDWEGVPAHWSSYLTVADADAAVEAAKAAGGTLHHGPMDVPNVGRFAIVNDAAGAPITMIAYVMPEGAEDGEGAQTEGAPA